MTEYNAILQAIAANERKARSALSKIFFSSLFFFFSWSLFALFVFFFLLAGL
jgi:hypothetical protein